MIRCFRVHPDDNVATLIDDLSGPGPVRISGTADDVAGRQAIALGHKIALRDIPAGAAITKFGVPIGRATGDIRTGDWVHLHNCQSFLDERSGTLDVESGAVTDTKYE